MKSISLLVFFFLLVSVHWSLGALPTAVRTQFVRSTNQVRSNVVLGKQANQNGTKLPAGRNIYQLVYSTSLEVEAEKWVNSCVYKFPAITNVAGNALKMAGSQPITAATASSAVQAWLKPLTTYGLQSLSLTARDNTTLRGFVRMAWGTSREVGCAMKQCPSISSTLVVCLYSRANVKVGTLIYGRGTGCKRNADCTSYANSTCTPSTGLCYSKPPAPPPTTSTRASTSTTPLKTSTTALKTSTTALKTSTTALKTSTSTSTLPTTPKTSSVLPSSTSASTSSSSSTLTTPTTSVPSSSSTTASRTSTVITTAKSTTRTSSTPKTTTPKTTTASPPPPPPSPNMTESQKQLVVDLHNKFRSAVALGQFENKNGTKFPTAANMNVAQWSDTEANVAASLIVNCTYNYTYKTSFYFWSGSSYLSYGLVESTVFSNDFQASEKAINDTLYAWIEKLKSYNPNQMVLNQAGNAGTFMVWNDGVNDFKVGCAVKYCSNYTTRVACTYDTYANQPNKTIYNVGAPCTECLANQNCTSNVGLCSPYSTKPVVVSLNDTQRMISVDTHNNYRSIVAKGNAVNKNGSNIPPATNMVKQTWSHILESYAKNVSGLCRWEHTRRNGTGQNYSITGRRYQTVEEALQIAVDRWYAELKNDGQNSLNMSGTNYNHWTQVVWATSIDIGCSVTYCPTMELLSGSRFTFVVCQYSPAGNYFGQNVYGPGTTCSKCPTGSTCEAATGLCKRANFDPIHN